MEAAGVKTDYVEYMMAHKRDTYHDIESLGIEKLRNIYASANLSIRPRTCVAKLDLIREFAKRIGVNPENIRIEPDTKFVDPLDREKAEIRAFMTAIRDELRKPPTDEIPPKPLIAPLAWRDRWDLNPRPSGLAARSAGARCPILVVLASHESCPSAI